MFTITALCLDKGVDELHSKAKRGRCAITSTYPLDSLIRKERQSCPIYKCTSKLTYPFAIRNLDPLIAAGSKDLTQSKSANLAITSFGDDSAAIASELSLADAPGLNTVLIDERV